MNCNESVTPDGGATSQDIPGSELALTVVPPGANGSLVAALSLKHNNKHTHFITQ